MQTTHSTFERICIFTLLSGLWSLVYLGIGHWGAVRTARTLPWDPAQAVPLVSVFVIPYLSAFIMPFLLLFTMRDAATYRTYAVVVGGTIAVSAVFFILFPLTIDRPNIDGWTVADRLLAMLYAADRPTNLFPSLHVSLAFLFAFGVSHTRPRWKIWMLSWAALIGVSTVFTHQHYVVDALAGALLAWVAWRVFLVLRARV